MLYVTSLDGSQVEPLTQFNNFQINKEVSGAFQLSLTSFNLDNPAHSILQEESIITVDNYDFRIKQLNKNKNSTSVVAISTYYDLTDKRQNAIYGGTRTFNEFASFVFGGTDWTFTSDVTGSKFIANFGESNVIALVNALCKEYSCEYEIQPNNHIHFAYKIGGDYGAQYRYRHNIKSLSEKIDTTKLKTQIKGYGGNGITVTYTSPNASIFGIREADPITEDNLTESYSLLEKIKSELIDYPEAYFEMDTIELTNKELGERVWLIHEVMGIEFQTRVLSQTIEYRAGQLVTTKVVLGNTSPKSITDILVSQKVDIDENKKEYRSKFEQTNDRITLSVEQIDTSIAALEIKADNINLSVNDRITNEVAAIDIRADQIESSVTDVNNNLSSVITQTASQIRSEMNSEVTTIEGNITSINNSVSSLTQTSSQMQSTISSQTTTINSLGSRVSSAESSITQQANQISSKVSQTDYTGRTITSLINQDPYAVSISADKINLNGAVIVNGSISGATNINVTTDINLGQTLRFSNYTTISSGGTGDIHLDAWGNIYYGASTHQFRGNVDFSYATVTGLGGSDITMSYSTSAGKKYITFRQYGSYLGMTEIT